MVLHVFFRFRGDHVDTVRPFAGLFGVTIFALMLAQLIALGGNAAAQDALVLPIVLVGDQRAELRPRVEGYIESMHVDIGDHVKAGQVLITIDAPELEAEVARKRQMLAQAQANVGVAEGQVGTAEARLHQANSARQEQEALLKLRTSQRDRYAMLVRGGAVEQEKLDEAEYALMAVRAALARIEADIQAARAAVDAAKNELDFARSGIGVAEAELIKATVQNELRELKAPFDALVTARQIDPGNLVSPQSGSMDPLLTVERVDVLRAIMTVPAEDADSVHIGDPVTLIGFAGDQPTAPDGSPLKISRMSQSLNNKTRTMRIEIDLKNPLSDNSGRYRFRSGQYGSARVR